MNLKKLKHIIKFSKSSNLVLIHSKELNLLHQQISLAKSTLQDIKYGFTNETPRERSTHVLKSLEMIDNEILKLK